MHLIWTILIGFVVMTLLGIGGSLAATYLGHRLGLYQAGETAGFIGAVVGAVVLLLANHLVARR